MNLDAPETRSATPTVGARKFYGKYRGTVIENIDPQQIGRVLVIVPDVGNLVPASWAMPCAARRRHPVGRVRRAGDRVGRVGPVRARRPRSPDLGRRLLGLAAEVPALALVPRRRFRRERRSHRCVTPLQNTLLVSDAPPTPLTGGIVLKSTTGAMIVVNDVGIFINNGKGAVISMLGPVVDINLGALTII